MTNRLSTVSYTHLTDGYCDREGALALKGMMAAAAPEAIALCCARKPAARPVSYTHLDVYKRQAEAGFKTSLSMEM